MEFPKSLKNGSAVARILAMVLGAGAGFAYYTFIGCYSGTCPITSNPWLMTGYGALVGALALPWKSRNTQKSPTDLSNNREDES